MSYLNPPIAALGCRVASSPATPVVLAHVGAEPTISDAVLPFLLLAGVAVWAGYSLVKAIPEKAGT